MNDRSSGTVGFDALLQDLRPARASYGRLSLEGPWGIALPYQAGVRIHFLVEGACQLDIEGESVLLKPGDLALVPHGGAHTVRDRAGTEVVPLGDLPRTQIGPSVYKIHAGPGGKRTLLICCTIDFDAPAARRVLAMMPTLLVLTRERTSGSGIDGVLAMMAEEARRERLGMATLLPRLADIVATWSIRTWIEQADDRTGWIAALRMPGLGRVLAAIHGAPEIAWPIAVLARMSGMSRSTFVAVFTDALGQPPGRYHLELRMAHARERLLTGGDSIAKIAAATGYKSDAAFSRAFTRVAGATPGQLRRAARNGKPS